MAFFLRRSGNHAEAEDLTQEAFVRMLSIPEGATRPEAYVFQIAANLLVDEHRKRRVREQHRLDATRDIDLGVDYLDPHAIASGRERMAALTAALQELPERMRAMFILYRFENMSQEMIGSAYGISASAVKQQIAKAMVFLNRRMKSR